MKFSSRVLLPLVALGLLTGCEQGNSKDAKEKVVVQLVREVQTTGTPEVLATIGSEQIRDQDLRNRADVKMKLYQAELGIYRAEKQAHDAFKSALDEFIEEKLTSEAASKRKVTVEELLKKEVNEKAKPVTDKEAKAFYDEKKIDRPFDTIKERVKEYLFNEKLEKRRQAFLDELKKKNKVDIKLAEFSKAKPLPPKVEVKLGDDAHFRGPTTAPITIVEFSDYQCPHCKRGNENIKELMAKSQFKDKIRTVHMHYPLPFHNEAIPAAMASECAKEQNKFWEYHDLLFNNQQALKNDDLIKHAVALKMDEGKFKTCLDSKKYESVVQKQMEEGKNLGVTGTPAFFINGRMLSGAQPTSEFESIIQVELGQAGKSGT